MNTTQTENPTMTQPYERESKFLCFVLRHTRDPEVMGVTLDTQGWADIEQLLAACQRAKHPVDAAILKQIVATDEKGRYAFSVDGLKVRCLQGHSSPMVDLDFEEKDPPPTLFHGTVLTVAESILSQGLWPQKRHYVHLSRDLETATNVGGRRKGELVVFQVDTRALSATGRKFYQSENEVWLTDHVPAAYLRRLDI